MTAWWQFNFFPLHESWYHGATWPNVVAIVPCALALWLWLRARHAAVMEAHTALKVAHLVHAESLRAHAEKLDKLLDHFDPDTGTIAELHTKLDAIAARLRALK